MNNTEKLNSFEKLYQAYQTFFTQFKDVFGLTEKDFEEDEQEINYKDGDCEKGGCFENEKFDGALVEKKSLYDVFTEKVRLFKNAEYKKADKLEKYADVLSDFFVNCVACAINDSDERRKFFKELYDSTLDIIEGVQFNFAVMKEDNNAYEILEQYINPNVDWATQTACMIRTADFIEDKLASEFGECPDFHVDLIMYPTKFGDIRDNNGASFAWTHTNTMTIEQKMDDKILGEERLHEMKDDIVYHVILKLLFK